LWGAPIKGRLGLSVVSCPVQDDARDDGEFLLIEEDDDGRLYRTAFAYGSEVEGNDSGGPQRLLDHEERASERPHQEMPERLESVYSERATLADAFECLTVDFRSVLKGSVVQFLSFFEINR
jgi:hypothetical protein